MECASCKSRNLKTFESEITIHFAELRNVDKVTLAFPRLVICLDCGFMEARLAESELRELGERDGGDTKESVA